MSTELAETEASLRAALMQGISDIKTEQLAHRLDRVENRLDRVEQGLGTVQAGVQAIIAILDRQIDEEPAAAGR